MHAKFLTAIIIALSAVLVTSYGYFSYEYIQASRNQSYGVYHRLDSVAESATDQQPHNQQPTTNNEDTAEEITSDIDTSDWQTYRNEEYGFEFKYPEEWEITIDRGSMVSLSPKDNYIPPMFIYIRTFYLNEENEYRLERLSYKRNGLTYYLSRPLNRDNYYSSNSVIIKSNSYYYELSWGDNDVRSQEERENTPERTTKYYNSFQIYKAILTTFK